MEIYSKIKIAIEITFKCTLQHIKDMKQLQHTTIKINVNCSQKR